MSKLLTVKIWITVFTGLLLFMTALVASAGDSSIKKSAKSVTEGDASSLSQTNDTNAATSSYDCARTHPSGEWLDKLQAQTHERLCSTVRWFDGLFGDKERFDNERFSGKVILGFEEDEREGFDPKLRIRIKSRLPNVSKRFNAFVGRVEEDSYISDTRAGSENVVDRSINADGEDPEWLIGLGYSKNADRGFDYSIGAKISSGLNPYAKVRYRYLVGLAKPHYLNLSQTLFWRDDDGYGTTSNLKYSYDVGTNDILGFTSSAKFTQESDQWESISGLTWYHKLRGRRGIATRAFFRGEEKNPVKKPEYGLSLTYRQPIFRKWLFLETGIENKWVRDEVGQPRDEVLKFGLQMEMSFGRLYQRQ